MTAMEQITNGKTYNQLVTLSLETHGLQDMHTNIQEIINKWKTQKKTRKQLRRDCIKIRASILKYTISVLIIQNSRFCKSGRFLRCFYLEKPSKWWKSMRDSSRSPSIYMPHKLVRQSYTPTKATQDDQWLSNNTISRNVAYRKMLFLFKSTLVVRFKQK